MVPLLEPDAFTTLSTLKNAISSAVPSPSGRNSGRHPGRRRCDDGRGVPGVGQVGVGEIQRDMRGVRRERQRVIGLFGDGSNRNHADDGLVVGSGHGDLDGLHGGAAVIVGYRDVVGQDQRLALGQKIKVIVSIAETPFQRARAAVVAGDLRGHRSLEMRQRCSGDHRTARQHRRLQHRGGGVGIAVVGVGKVHRAGQLMQRSRTCDVGSFGEAARCG